MGKVHSLDDFLQRLTVADVLDLLEDAVVGGLAVVNALFDGLIGVAEDLVAWVQYLLNEPIQVPVLTAFYRSDRRALTLLSVISLVCAAPLILILRLVDGAWPDFSDGMARAGEPGSLGMTTSSRRSASSTACAGGSTAGPRLRRHQTGQAEGIGDEPALSKLLLV